MWKMYERDEWSNQLHEGILQNCKFCNVLDRKFSIFKFFSAKEKIDLEVSQRKLRRLNFTQKRDHFKELRVI